MAFCSACGTEVNEGDGFCQKCGAGQSIGSAASPAAAAPVFTPATPVKKGANAPCPNCGNFKRDSKSVLSNIGKVVIAIGFLPGVIGAYQYITFDNKEMLERAAYQMAGQDPRMDAAMFIGMGIVVMVIGVVIAVAGNLATQKVCSNCGYKFKRGE